MSFIRYPNPQLSAISTYANQAALPVSSTDGDTAITLDTDTLWIYNLSGAAWKAVGSPSAVLSVGTIDSQTPSANGAVISANALVLQSASATVPGLVNLTTQTLAGVKTFSSPPNLSSLTASTALVLDGSKNITTVAYVSTNTASTIVLRDGSGNFSAGTITAALTGTASGNTTISANNHGVVVSGAANVLTVIAPDASATKVLKSGGAAADPSWLAYDNANTVSTLVFRDGSGNFSAGTITATVTGTSSGNTTISPNNHGVVISGAANVLTVIAPDASATKVLKSGGASADPSWLAYDNANTASTLVFRDGSGNFAATTITAALTGTASGNTTYSANNHGVVLSGAANVMTVIAPDASTAKVLVSGGSSADPAWSLLTNTNLSGSAAVSNANLAAMANNTFKGNISGGSATPSDLTIAQMVGALQTPLSLVTNITTTVNIAATASFISGDTSGGAYTATFVVPTGNTNKSFSVRKTTSDFNTLTMAIATSGSFIENGVTSSTTRIDTIGETIVFISDGTNYEIVSRVIPSIIFTFTPALGGITAVGNGYLYGSGKRIGSSLQMAFQFVGGTTSTYAAATAVTFGIPSGITIDTAQIDARDQLSGSGYIQNATSSFVVLGQESTTSTVGMISPAAASVAVGVTTATPALLAALTTSRIAFTCQYPITGWKG